MNAATPPKPPPPPPSRAIPKSSSKRAGDRIEVIKVLVLAIVSFLAGFALVFLFLRPSTSADEGVVEEHPAPLVDEGSAPAEAASSGYAPDAPPTAAEPAGEDVAADEGDERIDEGDAPPEVPPGKTPDGVAIDGSPFYLKCWDAEGIEHKGEDCDALSVLEKRFSTRLYVVDKCRLEAAGEKTQGKLSVAMEVDFDSHKLSFWSGAKSDIKSASKIGGCLRTALAGLPIHGVDHKFSRYRIFHTVLFGGTAAKQQQQEAAKAAKYVAGKGKMVDVVKDRVRVRKSPKDGDIIGKISSGNQVRLLEKKAGWCHIVTPNKNDGWMICDALGQ